MPSPQASARPRPLGPMPEIDLYALGGLPGDECEQAAGEIVASMVAYGATVEELNELQHLLGEMNYILARFIKPH